MTLTVRISQGKAITLILKSGSHTWQEVAPVGEDLVETLDKILKRAKIGIQSIKSKSIRIVGAKEGSLTSVRLAKTFQKALAIANEVRT